MEHKKRLIKFISGILVLDSDGTLSRERNRVLFIFKSGMELHILATEFDLLVILPRQTLLFQISNLCWFLMSVSTNQRFS